jgi:hypothetical protein
MRNLTSLSKNGGEAMRNLTSLSKHGGEVDRTSTMLETTLIFYRFLAGAVNSRRELRVLGQYVGPLVLRRASDNDLGR